ncbi:hypothetical protein BHM03_00056687 [Ensete ventricosum]|nr:hypothetical protein BHM03_00056687 [Ensete ventricosum]
MVKRNYRSNMDAGSSLGIGPRIGRCGGNSPRVRYDFAEGIGKITKNTPGDRRRKVVSLATGNVGEIPTGKPPVSDSWTARTLETGWLSAAEPLRTSG